MSHHLESRPRKDVAGIPHQQHADHGRGAKMGILPSWADKYDAKSINARLETAATKPYFRKAWKSGRCLIPADRWYDWSAAPVVGTKVNNPSHDGPDLISQKALLPTWTATGGYNVLPSQDGRKPGLKITGCLAT